MTTVLVVNRNRNNRRRNTEKLTVLHEAAVAMTDDCLLLQTGKTRPTIKFNGQMMAAARAVWVIANGDPGKLRVLHTCHKGDDGCINIRHLYLGTQKQNIRDRQEAGRDPRAKLTPAQVTEIKSRYVPGRSGLGRGNSRELAKEFGIARQTLLQVIRGDRYGHLLKEKVSD